jgi:hypothetical protein
MKTTFLAAAATLLLLGDAAYAKPAQPSDVYAIQVPQVVAPATSGRTLITPRQIQTFSPQTENPTGLPSYYLRPDGLMTNGLLPANGWQG